MRRIMVFGVLAVAALGFEFFVFKAEIRRNNEKKQLDSEIQQKVQEIKATQKQVNENLKAIQSKLESNLVMASNMTCIGLNSCPVAFDCETDVTDWSMLDKASHKNDLLKRIEKSDLKCNDGNKVRHKIIERLRTAEAQ